MSIVVAVTASTPSSFAMDIPCGHDSLYDEANELLRTSEMPPWPSKGKFPPASHVETKYATWMKKAVSSMPRS
jgi:hypothetical protein